ncbi:hypothetical protein A9Q99_08860 [Gammaproteobacteria bacterium 45_16_T64]|nr:hypothetical protein A9Q99_08860 [Gammaproteobacteria bacterium 45_16_T64]
MTRIVVAIIFMLQAFSLQASSDFYLGAQWGAYQLESDESFDTEVNAAGVLFGYRIFDNVAVESRIGLGLGSYETEYTLNDVVYDIDVTLDHYVSAYIRPQIDVNLVTLYGLAGLSKATLSGESTSNGTDIDVKLEDSSFSYGAGIGYVNADDVEFNLEYIQLVNTGDYSVGGINFSVQFPLGQSDDQEDW